MLIYCLFITIFTLALGSEAMCWTITIIKHAAWLKKHPDNEIGLAIDRSTIYYGSILSGSFCTIVWVYFIYCISLIYTGKIPTNLQSMIGVSLASGVFLTHIHVWGMLARYLCLHTKFWPFLSSRVYMVLNKISGKREIALYCLLFERWRSILPITETHKDVFSSFFDVVSEVIWSQDTLGRVTYGNKSAFRKFGGSEKSRLLGGTIREITQFHKDNFTHVSSFLDMNDKSDYWVLTNQKTYRGVIYGSINNKFHAMYITKSPIYELDDNANLVLTGIVCLGHDITIRWEEHDLVSHYFNTEDYVKARNAFEEHRRKFEGAKFKKATFI